jgi:hypothetical protein
MYMIRSLLALGLLAALALTGCAPISGQVTRDSDEQAPRGSGTVSVSRDLRGDRHEPSDSEVRSMRESPAPPPRTGD